MKKYENYNETQAFTGEYETLEPGGYICKILKVAVEDGKHYGSLMRIAFDIADGEHEGFYKRLFERKKESNPDAKWPGMYYQTVKEDDLRFFKGFMTAIENSNGAYKWNWDEKTLVGKFFGGVFGEEEYMGFDGQIKTSVKCMQVRGIDAIREGRFKVPERKKLNISDAYEPPTSSMSDDDDELPF